MVVRYHSSGSWYDGEAHYAPIPTTAPDANRWPETEPRLAVLCDGKPTTKDHTIYNVNTRRCTHRCAGHWPHSRGVSRQLQGRSLYAPAWLVPEKCAYRSGGVAHLPVRIVRRVLMACCVLEWPSHLNRTCVLCVGNKVAEALVKGGSTSPIGSILACLFWTLAARGSTMWRAEYAHAISNIADNPPRTCNARPCISRALSPSNAPVKVAHALSS